MEQQHDIVATFYGVRGSIATPGKQYQYFGGNTSCIEVRCANKILILDAGTGIKDLGIRIAREFADKKFEVHLLLSHSHWDHIQGFPFFTPIYMKNATIHVYGGHFYSSVKELLEYQMHKEFFPLHLQDLMAKIHFHDITDNQFTIGDIPIYYKHLMHPSLSIGYRITYNGKTFVYATDNELVSEKEIPCFNSKNMESLVHDADVLIADGQYTENEYKQRKAWGHSPIERVVKLSNNLGVKNLYLFHHDPYHDDKKVREMLAVGKKVAHNKLKVFAAREGTQILL